MDLEQLTKHQIILLTLLVSFVTSIATGIVTVSLMDQAPSSVTRVINQIVEHTVETVSPPTQGAAAAQSTEKTVVVKDDDLAAQSIAKVQKGIVRIVEAGGKELVARGVIIDGKGTAITDTAALHNSGASDFEAILSSGERVPAKILTDASSSPTILLALAVGTSTGFAPVALSSASKLQLGQSIIRIGGIGSDTVGNGVIASLPRETDGSQRLIEASVGATTPGSVLITLFGEVIGITTSSSLLTGNDFYSTLNLSSASKGAPAAATSSSNL
jgi:hypothetical protein